MARAGLGLQGSSLGDAEQSGVVTAFVRCPEGEGRCGVGEAGPARRAGPKGPGMRSSEGPSGQGDCRGAAGKMRGSRRLQPRSRNPYGWRWTKALAGGCASRGSGGAAAPGRVRRDPRLRRGAEFTPMARWEAACYLPAAASPGDWAWLRSGPLRRAGARRGVQACDARRDLEIPRLPSVWRPFPACVLVGPRFFPTYSPHDVESRRAVRAPAASLALTSRAVAGAAAPGRSDARGGPAF